MAQQNQQDEQDQPWKQIFRLYFREGIEFLFPEIACEIDWSKPIDFLDKEFGKIAPDAVTGNRFADQLVKVCRKHGKPIFLLMHVEVQVSRESNFAYRILPMPCGFWITLGNLQRVLWFCVMRMKNGDLRAMGFRCRELR